MMKPVELETAHTHARVCWDRLVEHCRFGNCTCHLHGLGSPHILSGCATGRMLYEEYSKAAERVRELSPPLEFGDFDKSPVSDVPT